MSVMCRWLCVAGLTAGASAQPAIPPTEPAAPGGYLRVVEERDKLVALEVAARTFAPISGHGPSVTLVAVAHLGERELFESIQALLAEHEVVFYESVKPPGAVRPGGATDEERRASTQEAMGFVAAVIEACIRDRLAAPADLEALRAFAGEIDSRLKDFVDDALVDGWSRALIYQIAEGKYALTSLGADGASGGDGPNGDLTIVPDGGASGIKPLEMVGDDGIQADLARSLGLQFQLDALDYDHSNWRCSDMTMGQLEAALSEKGVDLGPLGDALAGTSLPARIGKFMLGLVRVLDGLTQGASTDLLKIMLIEILGNERMIQQALDQFDPAFAEVIVDKRNQVVIDDLKALAEREPTVRSVAVLYGAAHMPDMTARLVEQLQYEEAGEATWMTAIAVKLAASKLPARDARQLRLMLRQMLRQQLQAMPPVKDQGE